MSSKSIAIKLLTVLFIVLASTVASAQYDPKVNVKWTGVTTQEDGTVIDTADVAYIVYNADTGEHACEETQDTSCSFTIAWGDCVTLYAKAKQISTTLLSKESNSVQVCSGVRPDFPLSAPVIEVTLGAIGE